MANPYDNPEFAYSYALNQADRSKNRYEWAVTHPGTLQLIDDSVERVLDYGCGGGVFTALMTASARESLNPGFESVGTDASAMMMRYAMPLGDHFPGTEFRQWDAVKDTSDLQDKSFDRVFAKLVLNYISNQDLADSVMPRLRECLKDDGLLVAVLPNPLREVGYSKSAYSSIDSIDVNVGSFSTDDSTKSFRHTFEDVIKAADSAGFEIGTVLGLPEVRFEPYKKQIMKIAHPMPMVFENLNAAKRWVYVFGATEAASDTFDATVSRFKYWRETQYPEIADRAHMMVTDDTSDVDIPVLLPHSALYDYARRGSNHVVVANGEYAEHLSPKQKIRIFRDLARKGIRDKGPVSDFLIDF